MFIASIFLPLSFVGGAVIGILVAKKAPAETAGLLKLAMALSIGLGLVLVGTGFAWITAGHAPTVDGRRIELQCEVRLPPGFPVRDSLEANELRIAFVGSREAVNGRIAAATVSA
ncbi:MAG: hypothetical protein FJ206_16160 [Gemmatimonadetes bacterium]|nr:hypothetical protein [Gemmatimonadota bacterium]